MVSGVSTARKNMNAREYNRSDKWSAHYRSNRMTRRSGDQPFNAGDSGDVNVAELNTKFLGKYEHDQTQVEIPVIDMITENNYRKMSDTQRLLVQAEDMLDNYEASLHGDSTEEELKNLA